MVRLNKMGCEIITLVATARKMEGGGWVPMVIENGHESWNWRRVGYDLDTAMQMARDTIAYMRENRYPESDIDYSEVRPPVK